MHDRRVPLPVLSPDDQGIDRRPAGVDAGDTPKERCGVVGIWGGRDVAYQTYTAMYALQHRGQESAGMALSDREHIHGHAAMGLVADAFPHERLDQMRGLNAVGGIGHTRYGTAGHSAACNAQPLIEHYVGGQVAIAHNGNLINAFAWRRRFELEGRLFHTTSDTEVIIHLLASPEQQQAVDPLAATLRRLQGAFSLVFLFPDRIEAARDPWGWRPLVLGRMPGGEPVVVSETVALDVLGAEFVREVEPGEIVTLSDSGVSSRRYAEPAPRLAQCVFEHVYFAHPSSVLFGRNVQVVREQMGARLAQEAPVEADYVMPMPDSGRSAAAGYARQIGIPYREGIVPNRYVGRTFIKPTDGERKLAVRLKLNVIGDIVEGKRLVVVDDSIVRGTTTRIKMQQLRDAGAAEIHLRISCPPIRHPCFFGIDFATPEQLIAHERTVEQIAESIGVDSLHFLSQEGMLASAGPGAEQHFCAACFDGDYRIDVERGVADEFTGSQLRMFDRSGAPRGSAVAGNADGR